MAADDDEKLDGIDDDDGNDDERDDDEHADEPAKDEHGKLICPECGNSFDNKIGLGLHRSREHGVLGKRHQRKKKKTGDGSPRRRDTNAGGRRNERKRKVRETILEAVEFSDELRGRSQIETEDLADILRRDADRIAGFLAAIAERFSPLGIVIDKTLGDGGLVSGIRALGPTLRQLFRRMRETNAERGAIAAEFQRRYQEELDTRGQEAADEFERQVRAGEVEIVVA